MKDTDASSLCEVMRKILVDSVIADGLKQVGSLTLELDSLDHGT